MSKSISAADAGTFAIGGDLVVNRLGFGAMRITGPGIWGAPANHDTAIATLKHLSEVDVNFIDTADSYGPYDSEYLIKEALHPYKGMVIATKGGLTRPGPDIWLPLGRPEYLRQCVVTSLRRLGVEQIDLWQLHRVDPKVPRDEQFEAVASMQKEGLIRHVGLSEVPVDDIEAAQKHFKVATVQNQYNLIDRKSEAVLDYCEQHGIGFIPWYPLAAGELARPGSIVSTIAIEHGVTTGAVALAWLLRRAKVMIPIPGTGSVDHLVENVAGASVKLTDEQFDELDRQGRRISAI
ncbi:aldo/keto reductase [Caballeronia insecticola]|uniref:Aldo/keto reductase n=1 Tax=Caballeronia insecticola TaxID=758793 RepID=R4WUI1_9BURK|nr:aldo/keto reductase [Caballeronia insecticola]BAN28214.1 aldo/keto reductase [Caballeronia insecticola]